MAQLAASLPLPPRPQFSEQDGARGVGTLVKSEGSASSQGGVWVRAKGTGAPTKARRGGPKGGEAQPGRQGEPELGQLPLSPPRGFGCTLLAAPQTARESSRLLEPSPAGVSAWRGPCLEGTLLLTQGAHSLGLLLPATVPVAPAVHLAAGAARTRHLRYLILPLRLQPGRTRPAYELSRPDITQGPPIPGSTPQQAGMSRSPAAPHRARGGSALGNSLPTTGPEYPTFILPALSHLPGP